MTEHNKIYKAALHRIAGRADKKWAVINDATRRAHRCRSDGRIVDEGPFVAAR